MLWNESIYWKNLPKVLMYKYGVIYQLNERGAHFGLIQFKQYSYNSDLVLNS